MVYRRVEKWDNKILKIAKLSFQIGSCLLELVEGDWFNHSSFEVSNFGGLKPFLEQRQSVYDIRFVEDPDGNVLELVKERKDEANSGDRNKP